ncbi:Methyltransf-25 domain-containing protein [Favolaschia claudopus]|uniref:Methyltransf-25 domain-containing protein n=1 Tax=Favolaschia claudopus TaxID=2862362 RepID=A0AAW0C3S5_9AGAR
MAPAVTRHPFPSTDQLPQKDVQAVLLKQRAARRRRPGEVPYPLQYTPQMINFDNWDHMFLQSCFGGLTAHQFESPPQVVLDLGCGGGYWALEAAKQWPSAQIVGYDLKDIQPDLFQLEATYMRCLEDCGLSPEPLPVADETASRVQWVHGNLLDGLPFPSDHFDFVHVSGIGLGVPEDEWQSVLEEISRVLVPNGILEIIEEDLIFPCAPPRTSRLTLPPLNLDFIPRERKDSSAPPSAFSSRSSNTMLSDLWSYPPESPDDSRVQKKPSLPTLPETRSDSSSHRDSIPYEVGSNFEPSLRRENTFFPQDVEVVTPDHHPEDHTRLKTAWDAMLSRRFLASSVITVLPFYLSSFFDNVQTHPSLQIPLPPSSTTPDSGSRSSDDSFDADTHFDLNPSASRLGDADMYSIRSKSTRSSQRTVPFWGRMHLAKTVNTVSACKEAVWVEYRQLFPGDLPPIIPNVNVTVRPNQQRAYRALKHSPREAFETDWTAWEHDMADRISMRGRVTSEFGWAEPEPQPDWRIWRTRMSQHRGDSSEERSQVGPNLCRSLRAFVGWKPAADVTSCSP